MNSVNVHCTFGVKSPPQSRIMAIAVPGQARGERPSGGPADRGSSSARGVSSAATRLSLLRGMAE